MSASQRAAQAADAAAFRQLIELGIALSAERDHERLLERIVIGAKGIFNAEGGTLYMREGETLAFAILRNDTLGIAMGGSTGRAIPFPALPLHEPDGAPNHRNVATHVALTGRTINIADAYETGNFDFAGTKQFDLQTGYRSRSFLTVPLKNHKADLIAVLQLINARDEAGATVAFADALVPLIEALASQAAVAIDNEQLIQGQKRLFEAFMRTMAAAVDAKSQYTGRHCEAVPVIAEMLAQAACDAREGPFRDFSLSEEQWYELQIAGGLHDVGKVATPVHIMDKATKLEKICDRIEDVRTRFELLKRDAELDCLRRGAPGELPDRLRQLDEELAFLAECNIGGEFMADEKVARVREIAKRRLRLNGAERPLLSDDEVANLTIRRGTLNDEDRRIINDHIVHTIRMLEGLPFPKHLRNVPEIAGGHHEKMDGTGYPRGLRREQMSLLARMMGIADIFEALTAADRPYKKPKTLSESLRIMAQMRKGNHIDPDLFELFLRAGVWRQYGERYLLPEQLDRVDVEALLAG